MQLVRRSFRGSGKNSAPFEQRYGQCTSVVTWWCRNTRHPQLLPPHEASRNHAGMSFHIFSLSLAAHVSKLRAHALHSEKSAPFS